MLPRYHPHSLQRCSALTALNGATRLPLIANAFPAEAHGRKPNLTAAGARSSRTLSEAVPV